MAGQEESVTKPRPQSHTHNFHTGHEYQDACMTTSKTHTALRHKGREKGTKEKGNGRERSEGCGQEASPLHNHTDLSRVVQSPPAAHVLFFPFHTIQYIHRHTSHRHTDKRN